MATCPTCNAEFVPLSNHYPVQKYCNRACKERAAANRRRAPARAEREAARRKASELAAELAAQAAALLQARKCIVCEESIGHLNRQAKYCSRRCYWRVDNQRRRPPPRMACELCSAPVARTRKRCSACLRGTHRARKSRGRIRRRVLEREVVHEFYTLDYIAKRDRHQCRLCHKRVAMTKAVPHPRAPTIDHVVPLAEGGQDTRANVQLAHFECNSRKRDRGTQQLALLG